MEFSRPEYWNEWPFLSPRDLPNRGISVGKESACNAGDSGLIPGSGRSAGEGISYPLQYSNQPNKCEFIGQMSHNLLFGDPETGTNSC